jgi:uncharacterized membrane protein
MIAAIYVALTMLSALMGLSSGAIQLRLSEAMCLLPLILPEAIVGLTLGCALANFITGCAVWDIVFGSVATLIGAVGAYLLKRLPEKYEFVATIPTVLANAIIIPFVLKWAYGIEDGYWFLFATVGIGEVLSAGVLGTFLYKNLKKVF